MCEKEQPEQAGDHVNIAVISSLHKDAVFQTASSAEATSLPETKKQTRKEWALAVCLLLLYVALSTGAGQMSNLAFSTATFNFKAPFLFVLFKTVFRSLAFPFYLAINTVVKLARGRTLNYCRTFKRCLAVCGEAGLSMQSIVYQFCPALFANLAAQILYTVGVRYLTASLASALGPPAIGTSYLLSWICLRTKLLTIKIIFVLVCFGGVAVIAYGQLKGDFKTDAVIGISALLASDVALSCYQVLFKKAFPKGDLGQISFVVTVMSLLTFLFYLPIPIILHETGVENYTFVQLPFPHLVGAWSCFSVSTMTYAYGLVVAGGFFMGLSDLLILAANTGIDALRGIVIPHSQIIGTAIISGAFLVLVLPDRYLSLSLRKRFLPRRSSLDALVKIMTDQSMINLPPRSSSSEEGGNACSRRSLTDFYWLQIFAINEDDVLEKKDLHIDAEDTQLKL
ncbi:putative Solute carrier family 35 member F4 [Hypsibius exemplaris]|uniref:Solute carrier family 35 member F4 n=1 Tax=Hypsibius exemplaris TaxID=2072580 RepID=A0A1W0W9A5_HYPEX|nr:putative Solute carrier family 35 member F4 [Hypsibius exemplaris]